MPQWSLAVERVRYVGEPVALVLAETRYIAEDAAEAVEIEYEPLPAVDRSARRPREGRRALVHDSAKSNEVHTRAFTYGDPDAAFKAAHKVVRMTSEFPRQSFMPMECFVVVADYRPADDSYEVMANFQGPFSTQPVMARACRVPGTRFRIKTPADSGGSFGIKLSVFPFMVLCGLASKIVGRPVKWVEDRLEHLVAASSGPNRITEIEAAVDKDGRITALQARPDRGLRRVPARADAGPALSHARRADRRLYDPEPRTSTSRVRADQQDAVVPDPRLRRPADVPDARAHGAEDRAARWASIISRSSSAT